jgi:V8-like Glu-specific endopeptidase
MTTMLQELDEVLDYEDPPLVIGKDTRVRINSTTESPFRFVCQIEVDGDWWGSGTLIGPRTVLTAGHCIHDNDGSGRLLAKSRIRIIPGRNGAAKKPLPASAVTDLKPMPGYASITRTDVGIITLADRIGDKIGWWTEKHSRPKNDKYGVSILSGRLPLPAGTLKVNLSGYPGDKPPGSTTDRGMVQYLAYDYTRKREEGLLYYVNDIYYGHSGGPVWVKRDHTMGGRVMVAINVGAGLTANFGVFIDATVRKFITDNILK